MKKMETLVTKYPKIFRDRHKSMTLMCWGFECGEGWYDILDQLCANIQNHIDDSRKNRLNALLFNRALYKALKGDTKSLFNYFSKFSPNEVYVNRKVAKCLEDAKKENTHVFHDVFDVCPQVVATQVKEKFGTLRFYYDGGDSAIDGMVRMAESMSGVTCETCGNKGQLRGEGWIYVSCLEHADK